MSGEWNLIPTAEWIQTDSQAQEAAEYLQYYARAHGLGTDTETTGTHLVKDVPLLMSLSDGNRRFAFWIQNLFHWPWLLDGVLRNPEIPKIGTKIKFDMHMCANIGINLEGDLEDTLVMDWLYDENRTGRHGLKETAKDHCGLVMKEFKEIFPMRKKVAPSKKNPLGIPAETAGEAIMRVMQDPVECQRGIEYAGLDAWGSVRVKMWLKEQLQGVEMRPGRTLWQHFQDTEIPFTRVLYNMERRGITVCLGHLRAQSTPMDRDLKKLEAEIVRAVGWPINPNSPQQLRKFFFEEMQLPPLKFTDGGSTGVKQPSTDYDTLIHFKTNFVGRGAEVAAMMITQREIAKAKSTYVDGLQEWADHQFRIHTTLNQHVTVTGRLSSVEPNLQNIPRPDEDKFKVRAAFCAALGCILVIADYDQLEMKLMAHFSQDPEMIGAIRDGKDLHCYTVALMYGENYEEVAEAKHAKEKKQPLTDRQKDLLLKRQAAKNTGFGLIYGIGPLKLSQQLVELKVFPAPKTERDLKDNIKRAKQLIDKYFTAFPGAKAFIDGTHRRCMEVEYVQTLMGRFRRLPSINAKGGAGSDGEDGGGIVAEAKRQAVNTIIQGTAADIAKQAMIVAENDSVLNSIGAQLLLQIHDELIIEVEDNPEKVAICKRRVQEIMEQPWGPEFSLSVKLTAAAGSGYTWVDAK